MYHGSKDYRLQITRDPTFSECMFNVLVTTDTIAMIDKSRLKKFEWVYVILDEGQFFVK